MTRIDPALLRITVDCDKLPNSLWQDPSSSLYANLAGRFDAAIYGPDPSVEQITTATIIAHEQRHNLDYYLTNYGSWLQLFWEQVKQYVPAIVAPSQRFVVPLGFSLDPVFAGDLAPHCSEHQELYAAAVMSHNHLRLVELDNLGKEFESVGGLRGDVMLEALASTFEIGPREELIPPDRWQECMAAVPRSLSEWNQNYVWPARIMDMLGLTASVDASGVANSRLWAPLLVAALMGPFHELRWSELPTEWGADHDELIRRTLPSRRFIALADRIRELTNHGPTPETPLELWEAVNEAAAEEFGMGVLDSMDAQISDAELKVAQALEQGRKELRPSTVHIAAHIGQRRRLHSLLLKDPEALIDPHSYWADLSQSDARMPADWFVFRSEGFQTIPAGLVEFDSFMYNAQVGEAPIFLKSKLPTERMRSMQGIDEVMATSARFLVRGALSNAWVGPELVRTKNFFLDHSGAVVIPPFGSREGLQLSR